MSDTFNINNIEKFCTEISSSEISDISKIIKQMILIKNDTNRNIIKKTRPYDIVEKMRLNRLTENTPIKQSVSNKILKNHLQTYDVIEDSIDCLISVDSTINNDLFDFYWEMYLDVLKELNINLSDIEGICNNSGEIYDKINIKIKTKLFSGKITDIPENKIITYISAISAYAFYKCKFLIAFEDEKYI